MQRVLLTLCFIAFYPVVLFAQIHNSNESCPKLKVTSPSDEVGIGFDVVASPKLFSTVQD